MLPDVYYARRELESLLGLRLGVTLDRDLLKTGFLRKHNFRPRRSAATNQFVSIAFRLTDLGLAERVRAARKISATARR